MSRLNSFKGKIFDLKLSKKSESGTNVCENLEEKQLQNQNVYIMISFCRTTQLKEIKLKKSAGLTDKRQIQSKDKDLDKN